MIYLATNPFCPYCYGNDRTLEKELPKLSDRDIMLIPVDLTNEMQEFDDKLYESYHKSFEKSAKPYLETIGQRNMKFYKKENIGPSKNVFLTYYFMRNYDLGLPFYHEVSKRFYETDFNFSVIDNLAVIVQELGIDRSTYLRAINNQEYLDEYKANKQMAEDADLDTPPTYVIDNEIYPGIKKAIAKIKSQ